jgi:CRP/FNR family cyclic AMP-dependent transcriptional regulator
MRNAAFRAIINPMSVSSTGGAPIKTVAADALSYLSRRNPVEYLRNQTVYGDDRRSEGLYLVVEGRVKLASALESGPITVIDIYTPNEFFGESGLLGIHVPRQVATAIETVKAMSWPAVEVREQMERQPNLGVALVQVMVRRCADFKERLQSLAQEDTAARVARTLLRFADRLGARQADGSLRIPPLTHQLLSEYVGTSRELVTFHMNDLRRQGYLDYSRTDIRVRPETLREYLRQPVHARAAAT